MDNIFTKHPHSVNETYFEHMRVALKYGMKMVVGGIAGIIHAVFPFLFETTATSVAQEVVDHAAQRKNAPKKKM